MKAEQKFKIRTAFLIVLNCRRLMTVHNQKLLLTGFDPRLTTALRNVCDRRFRYGAPFRFTVTVLHFWTPTDV